MHECAELGIKHVWMHRGPGAGSVSAAATDYGRQHGITVIDGGCPLMFEPTADFGHKSCASCMRGRCPSRSEPEERTISANKKLLDRYVERYNAGDLDAVMDLYAEDAVQNMPDGTFVGEDLPTTFPSWRSSGLSRRARPRNAGVEH